MTVVSWIYYSADPFLYLLYRPLLGINTFFSSRSVKLSSLGRSLQRKKRSSGRELTSRFIPECHAFACKFHSEMVFYCHLSEFTGFGDILLITRECFCMACVCGHPSSLKPSLLLCQLCQAYPTIPLMFNFPFSFIGGHVGSKFLETLTSRSSRIR